MHTNPVPALLWALIVCASLLGACSQGTLQQGSAAAVTPAVKSGVGAFKSPYNDAVVWAVNVGGDHVTGIDKVSYRADEHIQGGKVGHLEEIKGSQDVALYQSYRIGDFEVSYPVANGRYDIILKFAEPFDVPVGGRVINVFAEDRLIIADLDVRLARDNRIHSALERAVSEIMVTDGKLDLRFEADAGEPVLSAIVVRRSRSDTGKWVLEWADEFDYTGPPDPSRWNIDVWPRGKVNDEDQAYTSAPRNVRVENGLLVLEAHREDYQGADYTSGRINSANKGDILYGRVDVRARLPAGQGTWAAIFMLPTDPYTYATNCSAPTDWHGSMTCNAWPNSGEIDVMEHVGYDMQTIHGTVHTKAYYWVNWEQRKASIEGRDVENAFHTYSVEWTPDYIIILFDGSPYFYYANEGSGWKAWPFDHPFNLILNLAVGGTWGRGGGPVDDSIFPARMEVDYVRVYRPAGS